MRVADLTGFLAPKSRAGLAGLVLALGAASPALAQSAGIVQPGYAVVTGFSGTAASEAPQGEDPTDYLTIDYNGVSATVIDLTTVGAQGEVTEAPKAFSVSASSIGQVYGVALDNAPEPNIYLAATSAYGVSIYLADENGYVKRLHKGAPGAQFVPGQFGPEGQGGSPGSIWRIDGATGDVSLFANIESAAFGVASLGGLAFDPATQQLFAVERGNGVIHRFTLDGVERGTYDHGIEGRPGAGLAPVPMPPSIPVNISSPAFDTENPATWRYAPIARRIFGLAVRDNRLYYSVAQGPQIWSVAIAPNGAVGGSPQIEVNVPAEQPGIEIASIAFDGQGRMYLAERGPPTGDYQLTQLAGGGASRVLRFVRKPAGDPSPGFWRLQPDEYAIGLPAPYQNAEGGVALSYAYGQDGTINYGSCRGTLWTTGERLLDPGDPNTPPDSYPAIDGLQGNPASLVEPQNTPPLYSWFVDYDDKAGIPDYRGMVGAVATYAPCAGAPLPPPPPPPPPKPYCPPGTYLDDYGQCRIIPTCPPGTKYSNGICSYPTCPPGYVEWQGECVPPPQVCPPGTFFYKGDCYPIACPPNMIMKPNGYCACKPGDIFYNGKCVPPSFCPPGMITLPGGICWCPLGTEFSKGKCVPICGPGEKFVNGFCVPAFCKPGEIKAPNGKCVPPCKPWEKMLPNGVCVPGGIVGPCDPGEKWQNGVCVPICKPWQKLFNGKCVDFPIGPKPEKCKPWEHLVNGKCEPFGPKPPDCKFNEKLINGECVPFPIGPKPPKCKPNEKLVGNKCLPFEIGPLEPPQPDCGPNEKVVNGKCVPFPIGPKPPKCKPNEKLIGLKCVPFEIGPLEPPQPDCGPNEKIVNGKCVPFPIGPKPEKCKPNEKRINGKCVPIQIGPLEPKKPIGPINPDLPVGPKFPKCKPFEKLQNGECVPRTIAPLDGQDGGPPKPRFTPPKLEVQCGPGQKPVNGKCVSVCPPGQTMVDGACKPRLLRLNPKLKGPPEPGDVQELQGQ
jgi:hypothetical protein